MDAPAAGEFSDPPGGSKAGATGSAVTAPDTGSTAHVRHLLTGAATSREEPSLSSPDLYLNRELTWLSFNRRVLAEAEDERNPLLERLKFLAITSSNLDEFFMKRIGGLKQQAAAGVQQLTVDGRTPQTQLEECAEEIRAQEQRQREILTKLLELLRAAGVDVVSYRDLNAQEHAALREYYFANIFPLVTPLAIDPAHPFPFVSNLSLNLLVTVRNVADAEGPLSRVKVPVGGGIPRFLRVGQANRFVLLEEVMANNLDLLFPGIDIAACELFRVTRNANTERDEEEADDLLALIETELRDRRLAPIVRLVTIKRMDSTRRGMLAAELGLDERTDVFEVDGMLGMRDLMELANLDIPALHDTPHHPIDHPRLQKGRNIFHMIRDAGSLLLLHPYESFSTSVERFLREASADPKVRAIKMTVYRTSADAEIIGYLCDAARNGKEVAVVVELKARFDEEANIRFAGKLEEFGIHVTYGVVGTENALQGDSGGAPGLQRTAPLCAYRYRQLPSRHRADLCRFWPAHLRRHDRKRSDRAVQLSDDGLSGESSLPEDHAGAFDPEECAARADRARDRAAIARPLLYRTHSVQDEWARGRRYHPRPLPRRASWRQNRPDRARYLPAAAGIAGTLGERPRREHRRPLPRTRAYLLFPQRRR